MRLIDADEMKEKFDPKTWQGEMMLAIAENLPTAYDPEEVVNELEGVSSEVYGHDKFLSLNKAIEIVRKGGAK